MSSRREKYWTSTARHPQQYPHTVENKCVFEEKQWFRSLAGRQVQIPLSGRYSREITCSHPNGQAVRYRGKNRAYVTAAIRGPIQTRVPYVTARDEAITYYRGAISRFDGPCHTRHTKDDDDSTFWSTWKVCGKTIRAGGLPAVEYFEDAATEIEITRIWGARNGYRHRHSGPATTQSIKGGRRKTKNDYPTRIDWMNVIWCSRGYEHRANGSSCVLFKTCATAVARWYRYGIAYEL